MVRVRCGVFLSFGGGMDSKCEGFLVFFVACWHLVGII